MKYSRSAVKATEYQNDSGSTLEWKKYNFDKTELLREGIVFIIYLFARAILLIKKLKIGESKAT